MKELKELIKLLKEMLDTLEAIDQKKGDLTGFYDSNEECYKKYVYKAIYDIYTKLSRNEMRYKNWENYLSIFEE